MCIWVKYVCVQKLTGLVEVAELLRVLFAQVPERLVPRLHLVQRRRVRQRALLRRRQPLLQARQPRLRLVHHTEHGLRALQACQGNTQLDSLLPRISYQTDIQRSTNLSASSRWMRARLPRHYRTASVRRACRSVCSWRARRRNLLELILWCFRSFRFSFCMSVFRPRVSVCKK